MDSKVHRLENPEDVILGLISAALKTKARDKSYGTFTIELRFKEGWPGDWEVTDKTTHKIIRPQ